MILKKQWKKDMVYSITYRPKIKHYPDTNKIKSISFKRNGKLHNVEFPAIIKYYEDGSIELEEYYFEGKLHRPPTDGPAIIWYDKSSNIMGESYYIKGKLHRFGGPACVWYNDDGKIFHEEYWLDDKRI